MRNKILILANGTREEACKKFDEVKSTIVDFTKETVFLKGDVRNAGSNWSVFKIIK